MVLNENVLETVTPGGTIVLSEELPHVASVTMGVWVRSGSRQEGPGEEGLTHFLEHMFFKGTGRRSAREIAEEIDGVGGHLDAATGRESTSFFARVLSRHLPLACDVLGDIITKSLFRADDIERERGVVLEEIHSYEDEPGEMVMEHLLDLLYGDHPLARPILGSRSVIRSLDRDRLIEYRDRSYGPDRVVIAAAGQVKHDELLELLAPLIDGLPDSRGPALTTKPVPRAVRRVTIRKQEQVHVALAAPTFPFSHPRRYELQVLNNLLGGSVSSRLFQEIRERRGLAYGVGSGVDGFADTGFLSIHTAADPENYAEVVEAIGSVLKDLASGGVKDAEVHRACEQMRGNVFLSLESTSSRAFRMALSRIYLNRVTPLKEVMDQLDAVTPGAVREMASELLSPERFSMAVLGPGTADQYDAAAAEVFGACSTAGTREVARK